MNDKELIEKNKKIPESMIFTSEKMEELNLTEEQIAHMKECETPFEFLLYLDDEQRVIFMNMIESGMDTILKKPKKESKGIVYWIGRITSSMIVICIALLICGMVIFATTKILGWMFPMLKAYTMFW